MFKYLLTGTVIFFFLLSKAQNPLHISVSNTTLAATDSVLPFWFAANQHGKIKENNSFLNISEIAIGQNYQNTNTRKLGYSWGSDFVAAFGECNYYQINQAFAGVSVKRWELKGGMFRSEERRGG